MARQRKEEYTEVTACKKARRESSLGTENHRLFKTCRAVGRVCVGVRAAEHAGRSRHWPEHSMLLMSTLQMRQPGCGEAEDHTGSECRGGLRSLWNSPPAA